MKKVLTYICIVLLSFCVFLLQIFIIDPRSLFGFKPNLILIIVISVSLWYGLYKGALYSFLVGFACDIIFGSTNGQFTICYSIVGLLIGYFNYNYRKENKISLIYLTIFATAIFEICQYIIYIFTVREFINLFVLFKQIFIVSLLNICLTYIIYGVIYRINSKIDSNLNNESTFESLR